MPGLPLIYYGDEIGMRFLRGLAEKEGSMWRTGCRTPMQWSRNPNLGFSTAPARRLYLPVDPSDSAPTVEEQLADSDSLLAHTRKLLALRRAHPALANKATFTPLYARRRRVPFVYQRSHGGQTIIVAINPAGKKCHATITVARGSKFQPLLQVGIGRTMTRGRKTHFHLGPGSAVILLQE